MTSNGHARSMPLAVGVHGERDAHREDVEVGPVLALLQLGQAQLAQAGHEGRGRRTGRTVRLQQLVPPSGLDAQAAVGPGRRGRHARWLVLLDVMRVRTL